AERDAAGEAAERSAQLGEGARGGHIAGTGVELGIVEAAGRVVIAERGERVEALRIREQQVVGLRGGGHQRVSSLSCDPSAHGIVRTTLSVRGWCHIGTAPCV